MAAVAPGASASTKRGRREGQGRVTHSVSFVRKTSFPGAPVDFVVNVAGHTWSRGHPRLQRRLHQGDAESADPAMGDGQRGRVGTEHWAGTRVSVRLRGAVVLAVCSDTSGALSPCPAVPMEHLGAHSEPPSIPLGATPP